jgi:hypothetical protein
MDYPKFQAFIYSLDNFLPIVYLKQRAIGLPNANQGDNVIPGVRFRYSGLLRIYFLDAHNLRMDIDNALTLLDLAVLCANEFLILTENVTLATVRTFEKQEC